LPLRLVGPGKRDLPKVAASVLAANVAAFVGSEFLEAAGRSRNERPFLGCLALAVGFGIWAVWEYMQVRQNAGLTPELEV
jgi:NO-binding membrane sensor protein with MHYT domain